MWKAPAGLDASITGAAGLVVNLTDGENGRLNPRGINCLRSFPGAGRVAWGARTLTGVLGVNAVLGPLLLRLHFGHPFDIGGRVTPALAFGDRWVTNFTLRWLFF